MHPLRPYVIKPPRGEPAVDNLIIVVTDEDADSESTSES
jgi:hypothetical protein